MHGFINERGEEVLHEVGMRCLCNNEDTFAGNIEETNVLRRRNIIGCPVCGGEGQIFRDVKKIVALVTGVREDKNRIESGYAMPGDCILSPPPGYVISAGDRITFMWAQPIADGQVIVRGAANKSDNSAKNTKVNPNEDRLWYCAEESIWCEDEEGMVYSSSADFQLDGSRVIKWKGASPKIGNKYVIKYKAYLEWIAFIPPSVRRDRNRDIGERVLLKKKHVALINDNPQVTQGDKIPFCARISGC
jgi:hypothetical protein